jgi:hypothetical protein
MTPFMTIVQVVDAARGDVLNHIANGTMKKEHEDCGDDDENIYTIDSCYAQWAENQEAASNAISTMFEEEFSKYL